MSEDILLLILKAEDEYDAAIKNAAKQAEEYADACKKQQTDYIESIKQNWHLFEKSEIEKLEAVLAETEQKLEAKTAELKIRLKASQKSKADFISKRLKEEVISLYGNR